MLFGNPPPVHLILLKESSLCHNFYILMDFCLFFYGFFLRIDGTTTEETLLPFCPTAPDRGSRRPAVYLHLQFVTSLETLRNEVQPSLA